MLLVTVIWTLLLVEHMEAQDPKEGDLRLAGSGSTPSQGRVEIYHANEWGTVCDDSFTTDDASVVCRQLGFSALNVAVTQTSEFGAGTGTIWMDEIGCQGNELTLATCTHGGWNVTDCKHVEDVGVKCTLDPNAPRTTQKPPVTDPPIIVDPGICVAQNSQVRLRGPANGTGVVQVESNGVWGGVCDNSWDIYDARVVCGMLCYDPTKALAGSVNFNTSDIGEPMTINSVTCNGTESSIISCDQTPWADNSCERTEMARVTCKDLSNAAPSAPEPLLECSNGTLTASFSSSRDTFLEPKHLSVDMTYSGPCHVDKSSGNGYVVISVPFDECGTEVQTNATHIIYKTIIRYLPTSSIGNIGRANTYMVHVECEIPRDVEAKQPIIPLTETVTQSATGAFKVSLNFYRNSFSTAVTEFPLEVPLGEFLNIGLYLKEVDSNLRLVIPSCYATPTSERNNLVNYTLFTNKCYDDKTVGFFPFNETAWGFRYQTFKFVLFPAVYIHCEAIVCRVEETQPECDRSCLSSPTSATTAAAPATTQGEVPTTTDSNPTPPQVPGTTTHTVIFAQTPTPTTAPSPTIGAPIATQPPGYSGEEVLVSWDGSGASRLSPPWCFTTLVAALAVVLVL